MPRLNRGFQAPRPSSPSARPTVYGCHGMVVSPHVMASAAGARVLESGGNAVDAAIAANAVLAVVSPAMCGLGGDAMWLVFEPALGRAVAYNGSGRAPQAADADALRRAGLAALPERHPLTVTVPGVVRSWEDVAAAHGRFGLDPLLADAERIARRGFACGERLAAYVARNEALLQADPQSRALYLRGGRPQPGDSFVNEPLAETLAAIRRGGAAAFYEGEIAARTVRMLRAAGSPLDEADLARHRTLRGEPLALEWNGHLLLEHPPNAPGILAQIGLGTVGAGVADEALWTHLAVEALKRAGAAAQAVLGDPQTIPCGAAEALLQPAALAAARAAIDERVASGEALECRAGDTVCVCAADADGRVAVLVQSIYMDFGIGRIVPGTGVCLHNRGAGFSLVAGAPGELRGGRRPPHTLAPALLLRDGLPVLAFGAMGGAAQSQIQVQLVRAIVERGASPQAAVDAPRWVVGDDEGPRHQRATVNVEARLDAAIVAGLRRRGHPVRVLGPFDDLMGHAQVIAIDRRRGAFAGGADGRTDSAAIGL